MNILDKIEGLEAKFHEVSVRIAIKKPSQTYNRLKICFSMSRMRI